MNRQDFSPDIIRQIRRALKNEAAGNAKCTMTDLDLACDMLDELLAYKAVRKEPRDR